MPDLGAIAAGLTSIKTAIDLTKELKQADLLFKDAESKLKLADLIEALSEAKIQLYEARDENQELKDAIKDLESKLKLQGEVEFKNGHYFLKNPKDGQAPGPFCANCYSDQNKLIPVATLSSSFRAIGRYKCPKCESVTS